MGGALLRMDLTRHPLSLVRVQRLLRFRPLLLPIVDGDGDDCDAFVSQKLPKQEKNA